MEKKRSFDQRRIIHTLAISKFPVKLRVIDTLFLDTSDGLKIKSWIYTNRAGYLTVKRQQRLAKHGEVIKKFILKSANKRALSTNNLLSDVYNSKVTPLGRLQS